MQGYLPQFYKHNLNADIGVVPHFFGTLAVNFGRVFQEILVLTSSMAIDT